MRKYLYKEDEILETKIVINVIPNYPDYCVSRKGTVFRITEEGLRPLKQDISNGTARVRLNGHNISVARLVAEAYVPKTNKHRNLIFHIDGDKFNNNASNLCWMTASEVQQWSRYQVSYRLLNLPHGVRI